MTANDLYLQAEIPKFLLTAEEAAHALSVEVGRWSSGSWDSA